MTFYILIHVPSKCIVSSTMANNANDAEYYFTNLGFKIGIPFKMFVAVGGSNWEGKYD